MKKRIAIIISAVLLIFVAVAVYESFFSYRLIQGNLSDIRYISVIKQNENGNYSEIQITDSEQISRIYEAIVYTSRGKVEELFLMPSHSYSKDSVYTFEIKYAEKLQTVYIGYDDKVIFDLESKPGSSERGFAYLDSPNKSELIELADKLT